MEKSTIRILGVISGAFFIIGGLLFGFLINSLGSLISSYSATPINVGSAAMEIAAVGSIIGIVIIILSLTLIMSATRSYRIIAGVVIVVIGLYGSLYTLGGLIIGIILALIAGIAAMVHKDESQQQSEYSSSQQ